MPTGRRFLAARSAAGCRGFVQNWTETVLQVGLIRLVLLDIHAPSRARGPGIFPPGSREAVRRGAGGGRQGPRGAAAGVPRQPRPAAPHRRAAGFRFGGKAPAYADYIVFGAFQWARAISDFELLAADDPVRAWRGRMLDLFGGLARRAPAYGG